MISMRWNGIRIEAKYWAISEPHVRAGVTYHHPLWNYYAVVDFHHRQNLSRR